MHTMPPLPPVFRHSAPTGAQTLVQVSWLCAFGLQSNENAQSFSAGVPLQASPSTRGRPQCPFAPDGSRKQT
jgi:hypothetical protein